MLFYTSTGGSALPRGLRGLDPRMIESKPITGSIRDRAPALPSLPRASIPCLGTLVRIIAEMPPHRKHHLGKDECFEPPGGRILPQQASQCPGQSKPPPPGSGPVPTHRLHAGKTIRPHGSTQGETVRSDRFGFFTGSTAPRTQKGAGTCPRECFGPHGGRCARCGPSCPTPARQGRGCPRYRPPSRWDYSRCPCGAGRWPDPHTGWPPGRPQSNRPPRPEGPRTAPPRGRRQWNAGRPHG